MNDKIIRDGVAEYLEQLAARIREGSVTRFDLKWSGKPNLRGKIELPGKLGKVRVTMIHGQVTLVPITESSQAVEADTPARC